LFENAVGQLAPPRRLCFSVENPELQCSILRLYPG
jgi:hypothetical protein